MHLGRCPVDLVGQQQIVEQRPLTKLKLALLMAIDVGADQIRGQQIRRELNAMEIALDRLGQRLDRCGLGQPRHALDQEMTIA
jgi:hypothetical protein